MHVDYLDPHLERESLAENLAASRKEVEQLKLCLFSFAAFNNKEVKSLTKKTTFEAVVHIIESF